MKISARNFLGGKIKDVRKGATTAHVEIELQGGESVISSITNEAVEELGLKKGTKAYAVIKASDVMIAIVLRGARQGSRGPRCRLPSRSGLWRGMSDPQRFLRVGLENASNLAGQGGKDPGKLHFNAQGIVRDVNLRRRGLSKSHDPQIGRVAVPIDLAVSEFIDVIPAQKLYSPGNPPFRLFGAEAVRQGNDD